MTNLEQILGVRETLLNEMAKKLPEMAQVCRDNNYLCYFIGTEEQYYPMVDFTREMPDTLEEYQTMINESAIEYVNNVRFNYNKNVPETY